MWSFVGSKSQQRWLWHAIDHHTGQVLAYVFGTREDHVFLELQALLKPFGITRFYTDGWGAYRRHIDPDKHTVGKQHTQKIERKHTTLRARIKRLVRKTICFSKSIQMHDLVIGLFINRFAYGRAVRIRDQLIWNTTQIGKDPVVVLVGQGNLHLAEIIPSHVPATGVCFPKIDSTSNATGPERSPHAWERQECAQFGQGRGAARACWINTATASTNACTSTDQARTSSTPKWTKSA